MEYRNKACLLIILKTPNLACMLWRPVEQGTNTGPILGHKDTKAIRDLKTITQGHKTTDKWLELDHTANIRKIPWQGRIFRNGYQLHKLNNIKDKDLYRTPTRNTKIDNTIINSPILGQPRKGKK